MSLECVSSVRFILKTVLEFCVNFVDNSVWKLIFNNSKCFYLTFLEAVSHLIVVIPVPPIFFPYVLISHNHTFKNSPMFFEYLSSICISFYLTFLGAVNARNGVICLVLNII